MIGRSLEIAAGALLLVVMLYDLFQSVVLPRPAVGRVRFSPVLIRWGWRAWRQLALLVRRNRTREALLASFGPVAVMALLVFWGFLIALAYALLYDGYRRGLAPRPADFGTTLHFSVGRLLAFGVAGIEADDVVTSILTSFEAATGFAIFALVISLLFSLFNSFQRREAAVVALDALAGAPPSGLQLLETCAAFDMSAELAQTFVNWRDWTVDVLESHLSYPLLLYFRSSHDNEAWTNSFGAVMDAAALVLSVVENGPTGQARLMHKVGMHLVEDIGRYHRRGGGPAPPPNRDEFDYACARLRAAGYTLRDPETTWAEFVRLRDGYLPSLTGLAHLLLTSPASWVADPTYAPHRI